MVRYHEGQLFVIDVSQSVEYDHPNALEFLRKDCVNVNGFFCRRHGVAVMTGKELFDFVTDLSITDDNIDEYLSAAMKLASQRSADEVTRLEAEEEVSMDEWVLLSVVALEPQGTAEGLGARVPHFFTNGPARGGVAPWGKQETDQDVFTAHHERAHQNN